MQLQDQNTKTWKPTHELKQLIGRSARKAHRTEIINTIPSTWNLSGNPTFQTYEWVISFEEDPRLVFQFNRPHEGFLFKNLYTNYYVPAIGDPWNMTGRILCRARVITTGGDIKTTKINPGEERHKETIWLIGPLSQLKFDMGEWRWAALMPLKEAEFFNYLARLGYRIAQRDK